MQQQIGKMSTIFSSMVLIHNFILQLIRTQTIQFSPTNGLIIFTAIFFFISCLHEHKIIKYLQAFIFMVVSMMGFLDTINSSCGVLFFIISISLFYIYGYFKTNKIIKIITFFVAYISIFLFSVINNYVDITVGIKELLSNLILFIFSTFIIFYIWKTIYKKYTKQALKSTDKADEIIRQTDTLVELLVKYREILRDE